MTPSELQAVGVTVEALEACPFCDGMADIYIIAGKQRVRCADRGCPGHRISGCAPENWNTRAAKATPP
jgi:hypothetical protein